MNLKNRVNKIENSLNPDGLKKGQRYATLEDIVAGTDDPNVISSPKWERIFREMEERY